MLAVKLAEGDRCIDDVLTYALFPQIGLKFLENRGNPKAFEPVPTGRDVPTTDGGEEIYTVTVEGKSYSVTVAAGGDVSGIVPVGGGGAVAAAPAGVGEPINAPLAGNIFRVLVKPGQQVAAGERIIVLEAMKMETDISAPRAGTVIAVQVKEGDAVSVGDLLLTIG